MNLNGTSANRLSLPAPPSRRSGALARREGGRNEWGESRREGPPSKIKTSSPRPSPPSYVGRRGRGRRRPVHGFNARILFRGILTLALSPSKGEREQLLFGSNFACARRAVVSLTIAARRPKILPLRSLGGRGEGRGEV